MTRISNQYGAVNLSQGFPDFEPPRPILDRLAQVTKEDFHQYSTTWGAQNFREALAAKITHFSQNRKNDLKPVPPTLPNPKKNLNISKKACRKVLFAIFAAKYELKTQSTNYKSNV